MTSFSIDDFNLLSDIDPLSMGVIKLEAGSIQQAAHLSDRVANRSQRWQTYLNGLALAAWEHWITSRGATVSMHWEPASFLKPGYAGPLPAVCNLQVNGFKLCLIPIGNLLEDKIPVPRAVVDLPEFMAHFYVVIQLYEEQNQAVIQSFLRQDEWVSHWQAFPLTPEQDWAYEVPLDWFDPDPERLLLYLRCADPSSLSLPAIPSDRQTVLSTLQPTLASLLPQLKTTQLPWWRILTWEQGSAILTSPDLMQWLATDRESTPNVSSQLSYLFQLATQSTINTGLWLYNQLDDLAEALAWTLFPVPVSISALRLSDDTNLLPPLQTLQRILTQIERSGVSIPVQASAAYQDFMLGQYPLRLYAVIGILEEEQPQPEWSLLLVLGPQPEAVLPPGIRIQISDLSGLLIEQILESVTAADYLYAQVAGSLEEKFLAAIVLTDETTLTLPPFTFRLV